MTQDYNDILPADSLSSSLDKIEGRDDTLRDLFAGTSAPSSPVAYQLWADTTNNKIKQRNAANNAWVILGDLTNADMGHLRTDGTNTMAASLNFNSNKGINCTDPTLAQDVATKNYVDTTAGAAGKQYFYANVDTTAGSSSGLVTPSGSSLATVAWSASINNGFTVGTGIDQGAITVSTAGTYFISAELSTYVVGGNNGQCTISVRKAAGSSGSIIIQAQDRVDSLAYRDISMSGLVTFAASDTFDVCFNGGGQVNFNNTAIANRLSIFRVV